MDETVQLALKHERELRENLEEDIDLRFAAVEKDMNKKFCTLQAEIKKLNIWDRFRMVGFVLVGLWMSSFPEYLPFLKNLLK